MTTYRILHTEEICRELFHDFIRHQVVVKCWRRENGEWIIKDAPFIDDWIEKDYQILISSLKKRYFLMVLFMPLFATES